MIDKSERNAVRIIELPACKMIWSGVCKGSGDSAENEGLGRFERWMSAQDSLRKDRFYSRDFMCWILKLKAMHGGLPLQKSLTAQAVLK